MKYDKIHKLKIQAAKYYNDQNNQQIDYYFLLFRVRLG